MELSEYLRLALKWLWLFLVAAFVAGGIGFINEANKTPYYTARTTISIGGYIASPNPQASEITLSRSLAPTYLQLLETRDVLQGTIDGLRLDGYSTDFLKSLISAQIIESTTLMVISVTHVDPVLAADIANTVADQLILKSPTNLTAEQRQQVEFAQAQIDELSSEVAAQRQLLSGYEEQLTTTTDSQEIARLTNLRLSTTEQINLASSTIAQFQSTINNLQARINTIEIVERATVPTNATTGSPFRGAIVGAIAGVVAAGAAVLVIEYIDDRVKTAEIAAKMLNLPALGSIPRFTRKFSSYHNYLVTEEPAMPPVVEAYRRLRTNLLFAADSSTKNIIVVTSPGPGEGKSMTAANLAATMALGGLRVLLVDADLRRPRVHEIFDLPNEVGLTTLLFAGPSQNDGAELGESNTLHKLTQCIQKTTVPGLKVITSGFVPSNPTEVLGSSLMRRWLNAFHSAPDIDIIVIDTPPALLFSDSSVLTSIAHATVVMIVDGSKTRRRAALEVKEQFEHLGLEIKGVVVNRVNPREDSSRYYYGSYYYSYGPDMDTKAGNSIFRRLFSRPPT